MEQRPRAENVHALASNRRSYDPMSFDFILLAAGIDTSPTYPRRNVFTPEASRHSALEMAEQTVHAPMPSIERSAPISTVGALLKQPMIESPGVIRSMADEIRATVRPFSSRTLAKPEASVLTARSSEPCEICDGVDFGPPSGSNGETRQPSLPVRGRRPSRPTYHARHQHYIMFAAIVQEKAWSVIETEFARLFPVVHHLTEQERFERSRNGLNSRYYRLRREW